MFPNRCFVSGWEDTFFDPRTSLDITINQIKSEVRLEDREECEDVVRQGLIKKYDGRRHRFKLNNGEVCAKGKSKQYAKECEPSGGSPLVCKSNEGTWHIVGLVAWGFGCDPEYEGLPGIYVNFLELFEELKYLA